VAQILVTGSTSNVGRPLVERLGSLGERVRAASREPSRGEASDGVQPIWFDYGEPRSFDPALEDVDRVVVISPPVPTPHPLVLPFLESATRDRRKVVLMTAMGTEYEDDGSLRQVERALEQSGAPFVILRPNWFMDNFHTGWVEDITHTGVIALPAADARPSFIDARDIADAAVAALRSDRFDGRAFTLTGPADIVFSGEIGV